MLSHATKNHETHDAIERYVMAAIVDAREVYTDPKWLTWADHWINGRDRKFRLGQERPPDGPSGLRS